MYIAFKFDNEERARRKVEDLMNIIQDFQYCLQEFEREGLYGRNSMAFGGRAWGSDIKKDYPTVYDAIGMEDGWKVYATDIPEIYYHSDIKYSKEGVLYCFISEDGEMNETIVGNIGYALSANYMTSIPSDQSEGYSETFCDRVPDILMADFLREEVIKLKEQNIRLLKTNTKLRKEINSCQLT